MEDQPQWKHLTEDEKSRYVRLLRSDGHTDEAIGAFFGTTKGAIVGFRHRWLKDLTGKPAATKKRVDIKRFAELTDKATQVDAASENGTEPPSQQVTATIFTCEWPLANGKPCGKPCVPGSRLCEEHRALALKRM